MKMINKITLIASLVFAVGCTSSGKKIENTNDTTAFEATVDDSVSVSKTETAPESKVEKKSKPGAEGALEAAIKKQSDSEITSVANELLMGNPNHIKALNALGVVNYKKGKYKAAEFFLNKGIKASPETSALYNNLGLVKLAQGEQREAIQLFKTGLYKKSDDVSIAANLGSIYVSQKDYVNAEFALENLYKSGSKDTKALTNYAVALAANNKAAEATKIYEKLLSENSSSREIMLNYSIHLIENVKDMKKGSDILNRLKFVGAPPEARNVIKDLENKVKTGLNK